MDINSIINEIDDSITKNHEIHTSMGVVDGLAGASLFYYYLGDSNKCITYLEKSLDGLNETYQGHDILNDIMEIGTLLDFYYKNGFLSQEDIMDYFDNYDPIIESYLVQSLKEDNINPITGTLKYANYFVNRTHGLNNNHDHLLIQVLDKIEYLSIKDSKTKGIYWRSTIKRNDNYLVELGIKHGIMGIVDFLVSLYKNEIKQDRVLELIKKSLLYLVDKKLTHNYVSFPFCTDDVPDAKSFSLSLNYGDLGIAYGLNRVIEECKLEEYKNTLTEVLDKVTNFRDDKKERITDANLFYGSVGLASLLSSFKHKIDLPSLDESIDYWYLKTEEYKVYDNKWAGFDTTFNKFDVNAPLSMSHGIIGIGIGLINKEFGNQDFLCFLGFII